MNDRSHDFAIEDFYDAVFDVLPQRVVLIPPGRGSFGSASAYWRRTHDRRPDVVVATDRFARVIPKQTTFVAETTRPVAVSSRYLPRDATFTPVLRGYRGDLVLYRVDDRPMAPPPSVERGRIERDLGGATLVDAGVDVVRSFPPARVRVFSTWRVDVGAPPPIVSTRVDDLTLEAHQLRAGPSGGPLVAEEIELVLPSHLAVGRHQFALGVVEISDDGVRPRWTSIGAAVIE
jgi:hypothetical protein